MDEVRTILTTDWGKDHWSLLAYVESVCVDANGWLVGDRMRCNPRRHREFLGKRSLAFGPSWDAKYSTRLKGHTENKPRQEIGHDDWDCLNDLIVAGLAEVADRVERDSGKPFGGERLRIALTDYGKQLAAQLRIHMQEDRSYARFNPQWEAVAEMVLIGARKDL